MKEPEVKLYIDHRKLICGIKEAESRLFDLKQSKEIYWLARKDSRTKIHGRLL